MFFRLDSYLWLRFKNNNMLTINWNINRMSALNAKNSKEVFTTKTLKGAQKVLAKRQTTNISSAVLVFRGHPFDVQKTIELVSNGVVQPVQ